MKARELKQVNVQDYLTSEEAAETLGIQSAAIRNYLHLGKFTTYKFKSLTLLDAKEVERWNGRKRRR
jgi:excisionase family DNA binding protein